MVDTIGRCATPKENIENLLRAKQMHFPDQLIDWGLGIGDICLKISSDLQYSFGGLLFLERMQFLFKAAVRASEGPCLSRLA